MSVKMDIDTSQRKLEFTNTWFRSRNRPSFIEYIHPEWTGKPFTYLEIGVYEGQSLTWMFQHVLKSKYSRAVGIDPWLVTRKGGQNIMNAAMGRAYHNLRPWMQQPVEGSKADLRRCELVRGTSAEVLRKMLHRKGWKGIRRGRLDVCMVDGNHYKLGVLDDAHCCYELLRPGGWMLFDDVENDKEKQEHVKQGLAMFLDEQPNMKLLWKHRYMEAYRKEK
jgi:hypothetical protein